MSLPTWRERFPAKWLWAVTVPSSWRLPLHMSLQQAVLCDGAVSHCVTCSSHVTPPHLAPFSAVRGNFFFSLSLTHMCLWIQTPLLNNTREFSQARLLTCCSPLTLLPVQTRVPIYRYGSKIGAVIHSILSDSLFVCFLRRRVWWVKTP